MIMPQNLGLLENQLENLKHQTEFKATLRKAIDPSRLSEIDGFCNEFKTIEEKIAKKKEELEMLEKRREFLSTLASNRLGFSDITNKKLRGHIYEMKIVNSKPRLVMKEGYEKPNRILAGAYPTKMFIKTTYEWINTKIVNELNKDDNIYDPKSNKHEANEIAYIGYEPIVRVTNLKKVKEIQEKEKLRKQQENDALWEEYYKKLEEYGDRDEHTTR